MVPLVLPKPHLTGVAEPPGRSVVLQGEGGWG